MTSGSVSHRYARALMTLAQKDGKLEAIRKELDTLASVAAQTPRLISFLSDIIVPQEKRRETLTEILTKLQASELMRRFCFVLLERHRFGEFLNIVRGFDQLCDEQEGLIRARVISAQPLGSEDVAAFEKLLVQKTGKKVLIDYDQDPSLIGGVKVQLGSLVYDGSIRGDLERVQETMLK